MIKEIKGVCISLNYQGYSLINKRVLDITPYYSAPALSYDSKIDYTNWPVLDWLYKYD